ncbi:uncharacterized protein LOC113593764 [Acinonyx jubatus]|uniref:Uncharacterized protein LOC113593764 n=1 Tax=Acinonyx jubatus TaxID=32536 RepID=A0ABM3PKE7_ACIJB|nr:uncharacterized protein LOC113593764 [Acinonyx jubatus]
MGLQTSKPGKTVMKFKIPYNRLTKTVRGSVRSRATRGSRERGGAAAEAGAALTLHFVLTGVLRPRQTAGPDRLRDQTPNPPPAPARPQLSTQGGVTARAFKRTPAGQANTARLPRHCREAKISALSAVLRVRKGPSQCCFLFFGFFFPAGSEMFVSGEVRPEVVLRREWGEGGRAEPPLVGRSGRLVVLGWRPRMQSKKVLKIYHQVQLGS